MSLVTAKRILILAAVLSAAMSAYFAFTADIGSFLFMAGGVLMFAFLYSHPEMVMVQKAEALDEHIIRLKRIDYLLLIAALLLGIAGLIYKVVAYI
jgi:hypothetical protein